MTVPQLRRSAARPGLGRAVLVILLVALVLVLLSTPQELAIDWIDAFVELLGVVEVTGGTVLLLIAQRHG